MNLEITLRYCLSKPRLHAKWLNTLALMENVGAKKIKKYETPESTTLSRLRHAAEEARHAFFLKYQIPKLGFDYCPTFTNNELLVARLSRQYLNLLDVKICRYLKAELGAFGDKLKKGAYYLNTYSIEKRAELIYPLYETILRETKSSISVKKIIAEENTHLKEMKDHMLIWFGPRWKRHAEQACAFENKIFHQWQGGLAAETLGGQRQPPVQLLDT